MRLQDGFDGVKILMLAQLGRQVVDCRERQANGGKHGSPRPPHTLDEVPTRAPLGGREARDPPPGTTPCRSHQVGI